MKGKGYNSKAKLFNIEQFNVKQFLFKQVKKQKAQGKETNREGDCVKREDTIGFNIRSIDNMLMRKAMAMSDEESGKNGMMPVMQGWIMGYLYCMRYSNKFICTDRLFLYKIKCLAQKSC